MFMRFVPRLLFVAVAVTFAVYAYVISTDNNPEYGILFFYTLVSFGVAGLVVVWEWRFQREMVREFVAVFFGMGAGLLATAMLLVVAMLFLVPGQFQHTADLTLPEAIYKALQDIQLWVPLLLAACIYLGVTIVLQTRNDFRFLIPYIDFSQRGTQEGGILLDTSALIDGRILDVCQTGIVSAPLVIPDFVLRELQTLADSKDKLKRDRGRRGLDMTGKLQSFDSVRTVVRQTEVPAHTPVDEALIETARELNGRVVTSDFNLNKLSQISGVTVINLNDLANAVKPQVIPGEAMQLKLIRPGQEEGQGVGYLDDGTMVVVDDSADRIGQTIPIQVTGSIQTSAGRMIFGRPQDRPASDHPAGFRGPRRTTDRSPRADTERNTPRD